ncbi:5-formyltetrahydrofolate cyclo-ligase [Pectobacterium atrosepticum]|uniref:5-formyltetrahydrofolate cyclo-ligase n=1 Tax=Pectobacterium atrosepticum TaxID=29471 RepID=UPI0003A53181|nr:5-formyltetrahydrofolate cyclo-ligase [Pectobacterium atrosepticum]GKV85878.1 5-formyltetrahydrofolate cyclo-ligase [Pectobacterium carotovorum subsp. carotovorum]AIA69465.1 5-formyltetrahydrofolate cyclo-ligase [Pectobacterium atrosepticum]AIK12368.1 5-formyltetrahydrofolate cyclo-ligase [Pectobacterium atrosepticum]ATY89306.1 5-formyltetrahydrofolate cyclo-ligase [Pectobacterium atrosepticum]KFX15690.1 5-formyltetrahydrofolate cyclo-ligase [Pectobacterium atrosepticum]
MSSSDTSILPSTSPSSTAASRQQIRQAVRQQRRLLTPEQQRLFALQACERVMAHPKIIRADSVAVFLSFDGELDTHPLIQQLWQQGKRVYLPVLHPFRAGYLLFLRYALDTELVRNRLKIMEPRLDVRQVLPLPQLDILLTPLVAFDHQGQRLGMGGGFYDRTLQYRNQMSRGPYPIGLAHDCQQVDALPVESWDIPLPEIITPSRHWQWNTR